MSSVRSNFARLRRAFTLLEVIISVAILSLIAATLFRFVESTLRAIRFSSEQSSDAAGLTGLFASVQSQLNNLPLGQSGVLLGDSHQFGDKSSDEMQWICSAGNGLFTNFADGQYQVTLTLQQVPQSDAYELGVRRVPVDQPTATDVHWLHLLDHVDGLEIMYFDSRLNAWLEKWTDQSALPSLVRIRVWRNGANSPAEAILMLPLTRLPM